MLPMTMFSPVFAAVTVRLPEMAPKCPLWRLSTVIVPARVPTETLEKSIPLTVLAALIVPDTTNGFIAPGD